LKFIYTLSLLTIILHTSYISILWAKEADTKNAKDVTKEEKISMKNKLCPECNRIYPGDVNYCSNDGKELVEYSSKELMCPKCKKTGEAGEKFCKEDGTPLIYMSPDEEYFGDSSDVSPAELALKAKELMKEGKHLIKEEKYKDALRKYQKAEMVYPNNPNLHYDIGGVYWKLGNAERALVHLDKCKELLKAQADNIQNVEEYKKVLQDVDVYIYKLEKGLKQEKREERRKTEMAKRAEKMENALAENRDKWSEMVLIPAGEFIMGSPHNEFIPEETPQHKVYLDAYYIDKYEVTNAEYWEFLQYMRKTRDHSKCHPDESKNKDHTPGTAYTPWEYPYYDYPGYPVCRVDWYDAYAYAAWAGKRLPTEAEWEKAARGTDGRRFPWGNVWDAKRANVGPTGTLTVGSYELGKSVFGVYDVVGSVSEWCNDWYHPEYFRKSPSVNPKGPDYSTGRKIVKGPSLFAAYAYKMRCAVRIFAKPEDKNKSIGFRCAKDYDPEKKE